MSRHCLVLDLKDDPTLIARYVEWHAPGGPPAAVNASIRAADIIEMEIWLSGNRLFMIMEAGPAFDPAIKAAADATDPDVHAWETLMSEFQSPVAWATADEKWVPATRIYALSEQP